MDGRNDACRNFIKDVVKWSFLFLMTAQIISGVIWMAGNIGQEALFYDAKQYLAAVAQKQIGAHMGPLYPILIWIMQGIEGVLKIPYYVLMYLLQIGCAAFSISKLPGNGADKKMRILLGGYMLTFPLLMQMHLALLPYSLAMSVTICLVGECAAFLKDERKNIKRYGLRIGLLWTAAGLLIPEYGLFLGILAAICFVGICKRDKSLRRKLLAAFGVPILCLGVAAALVPAFTSTGSVERSVGAAALHRFVWPDFVSNQYFWDERVTDVFSDGDLLRVSQFPERIDSEFVPKLQEIYGSRETDRICLQMAISNLKVNTRQVAVAVGKDLIWNVNPILGNQMSLQNNDRTLNGWNYARLQDHTPLAAKYYTRISMAGWNVMCLFAVSMWLYKWVKKKPGAGTKDWANQCVMRMITAGAVSMVLWYTFTTGMQDYKKMMLITFLWLSFVLRGYVGLWEKGDKKREEIL